MASRAEETLPSHGAQKPWSGLLRQGAQQVLQARRAVRALKEGAEAAKHQLSEKVAETKQKLTDSAHRADLRLGVSEGLARGKARAEERLHLQERLSHVGEEIQSLRDDLLPRLQTSNVMGLSQTVTEQRQRLTSNIAEFTQKAADRRQRLMSNLNAAALRKAASLGLTRELGPALDSTALCFYDAELLPGVSGQVGLTIDDAPCHQSDPDKCMLREVQNLLAEFDAQATFFLCTDNVAPHRQDILQLLRAGHEVANHCGADRSYASESEEAFEAAFLEAERTCEDLRREALVAGAGTTRTATGIMARTQEPGCDQGDQKEGNQAAEDSVSSAQALQCTQPEGSKLDNGNGNARSSTDGMARAKEPGCDQGDKKDRNQAVEDSTSYDQIIPCKLPDANHSDNGTQTTDEQSDAGRLAGKDAGISSIEPCRTGVSADAGSANLATMFAKPDRSPYVHKTKQLPSKWCGFDAMCGTSKMKKGIAYDAEEEVRVVLPAWPARWFRSPHADTSPEMQRVLKRYEFTNVFCDCFANDTLLTDPTVIADGLLTMANARGGSIIVIHVPERGFREHNLEALRLLLTGLAQQGLRARTLTDLHKAAWQGGFASSQESAMQSQGYEAASSGE
eukprot:TRINITY_DN94006_c0_g1_i1.p1 TRINITY_DN94006_c0_g1~~TRINITY_DN94006_c0_g1_i1.p1  ORF type:complete len:623 (-),score=111.97 TRINITY_DN94006_c0_g1_i1:23-1891(-)